MAKDVALVIGGGAFGTSMATFLEILLAKLEFKLDQKMFMKELNREKIKFISLGKN